MMCPECGSYNVKKLNAVVAGERYAHCTDCGANFSIDD